MVALVQASTTLPIMLFSLAAGAIADNFDRRRVMLIAQVFMLAVSAGARARRLVRAADALGAARLHLPDRLRHGAQQPVLAGLGRRHRAARRPAGGGGAEQRRLQPDAQRRPGDRRRHRRGRGRGGGLRGQCGSAISALIVVLLRWRPDDRRRSTLPRERLGPAMGAGLRYVAMSPNIAQGAAARLPVRPDLDRGAGAAAAGRAPPRRRAAR